MKNEPAESVSQPRPESDQAGGAGKPHNFSKVLDCILVPRVIACDQRLMPGARLLWGVIRQRTYERGVCSTPRRVLAAELGVSVEQLKRYLRQLEDAKLLRTIHRRGELSQRALLWHERFSGTIPAITEGEIDGRKSGVEKAKDSSRTPGSRKTLPRVSEDPTPGHARPPLRNGFLQVSSRLEKHPPGDGEGESELAELLNKLPPGRMTAEQRSQNAGLIARIDELAKKRKV